MALPRAVCRVAEPTARAVADSLGVPLDQYLAYAKIPCLASPRAAPRRPAPPRAAPRRPAALSTCDTSVTRVTTSNTPRPRAARRRSEPVVDEAQGKQGPEERVARPVAPRRRAPGKEDPVPPGGRRRPRVRLLQRAHQPRVGRRP